MGGYFWYRSAQNKSQVTHLQLESWAPDVKAGLNSFMDKYAHTPNAYVVFDFDNTSSMFDMEEHVIMLQMETMSYVLNPEDFKQAISANVAPTVPEPEKWIADISTAYSHLYEQYGPFTVDGLSEDKLEALHADPWWKEFATKMINFYFNILGKNDKGTSYLVWIQCGFTGMTEEEVYALCRRTYDKYSHMPTTPFEWESPADIPSQVGQVTFKYEQGMQVTDNIRELWKALKENGIDVWVCSASGDVPLTAAVDYFGLHDYNTGILGLGVTKDEQGKRTCVSDSLTDFAFLAQPDGSWTRGDIPAKVHSAKEGKVKAIEHVLLPRYNNVGPLAGFMDATGDFWFCTMFKNMKVVTCFNRADRKVTDGGGLIAALAMYQRDNLGLNFAKADSLGETLYLLQGRDDNGLRCFRPSNKTIVYGDSIERLFVGEENQKLLDYMVEHQMSTADIINKFCILTEDSELGFKYGWTPSYGGYHTK